MKDEEHEEGARITLEKDGGVAPFSLTLGIYGALVDTRFYGTIENAEAEFASLKMLIDEALSCWSEHDRKPFNDAVDRLMAYGR
ncbi:MAG TPA: hypothetical protein VGE21_08560 [Flavobacteriales bacterium]